MEVARDITWCWFVDDMALVCQTPSGENTPHSPSQHVPYLFELDLYAMTFDTCATSSLS